MTKQEAIRLLEEFECIDDWSAVYMPTLHDAIDIAVDAIEKQIPKKPMNEEGKMWVCPNCYNNLLWIWKVYPTEKTDLKEGLPFCLSCGQAIDWSDGDEESRVY